MLIPKAADMGDSRLGNGKKLFDIRNRVAHSYLDKEEMAVGKMWFDACFPILESAEAFSNFSMALHNQIPSPDEARFCKKTADELILFLAELIETSRREEIMCAIETNPLGFNEKKEIYSVPFGETRIISSVVRYDDKGEKKSSGE